MVVTQYYYLYQKLYFIKQYEEINVTIAHCTHSKFHISFFFPFHTYLITVYIVGYAFAILRKSYILVHTCPYILSLLTTPSYSWYISFTTHCGGSAHMYLLTHSYIYSLSEQRKVEGNSFTRTFATFWSILTLDFLSMYFLHTCLCTFHTFLFFRTLSYTHNTILSWCEKKRR